MKVGRIFYFLQGEAFLKFFVLNNLKNFLFYFKGENFAFRIKRLIRVGLDECPLVFFFHKVLTWKYWDKKVKTQIDQTFFSTWIVFENPKSTMFQVQNFKIIVRHFSCARSISGYLEINKFKSPSNYPSFFKSSFSQFFKATQKSCFSPSFKWQTWFFHKAEFS